MARYEVLKKSYLTIPGDGQEGGPRLFKIGAKVTLANEVIPGSNLRPLDNAAHAAVARKEKAANKKPGDLAAAQARIAELEAQIDGGKVGGKTPAKPKVQFVDADDGEADSE